GQSWAHAVRMIAISGIRRFGVTALDSSAAGHAGAEVARARRAGHHFLRHLTARVLVGLADRLDVRPEDGLAVPAAPLVGVDSGGERALKARHHVAGEQLVAPERFLARRPLVRAEQHAAEAAARELDELLDAADDQIGRADERGAHA